MDETLDYQDEEVLAEAVAGALREAGLSASSQDTGGGMLCVVVDLSNEGQIFWGTADVNWGGAIHDADGEFVAGIETNCPSDTEDVVEIARTLKEASLANGAAAR